MIRELALPAVYDDELFPRIDIEIDEAVDRIDDSRERTRKLLTDFLQLRWAKQTMRSLPLLVYGAHTGDPGPAVPISAVHVLWYTACRFIDDSSDSQQVRAPGGLNHRDAFMAAVLCLHSLPLEILSRLPVSGHVREALAADLAYGSSVGVEGQLSEFQADPERLTTDSVLRCYQNKTGGGYAMGAAMAARLAGADTVRTDRWREFGHVFGSLRQLRNDQEDLDTGREEDLRNQVLTYLFVSVLARSTTRDRDRLLATRARAGQSANARRRLREVLLEPEHVRRYVADIQTVCDRAHRMLDELGGDRACLGVLHEFLDVSARPLPTFAQRIA